jgi:outer membrane protein assembly factor BamB
LFLLTAVPAGVPAQASHDPRGGIEPRLPHRYLVLAIDRRDGKVLWERVAREETPHEAAHQDNGTWASSSAVTDGELVIANFESRGLYAYDMKGNPVWQVDPGDKRMRNEFGEGTTPALHGNYLVLVWDHQGESVIVTFDKRTGRELWRAKRDEIDSWATPIVVELDGRAQVITSGMNRLRSYDLQTGAVVWHTAGVTMNPIPSPVAADGMVFVTSGFRGNSLKAIRLAGAKDDISTTGSVVWTLDRDTPYVPSPLLYDGILYILKSNNGVLSAFDGKTGKPHYQLQRLAKAPNVFASPVGAAGRVYIPGREGTVVVLKHGPSFEVLAENQLDDGFDASPALVDDQIFLRGYRFLYAISETRGSAD